MTNAPIVEIITTKDLSRITVIHGDDRNEGKVSYPFLCFHYVPMDRFCITGIDFFTCNVVESLNDVGVERYIRFINNNLHGKWFLTDELGTINRIFGFELEEDLIIFKLWINE